MTQLTQEDRQEIAAYESGEYSLVRLALVIGPGQFHDDLATAMFADKPPGQPPSYLSSGAITGKLSNEEVEFIWDNLCPALNTAMKNIVKLRGK